MKRWTLLPIVVIAIALGGSRSLSAQSGDTMARPIAMAKTYTGCVASGPSAGSFVLTHAMADTTMARNGMTKDAAMNSMTKNSAMGHEAMHGSMMIESKTGDLA